MTDPHPESARLASFARAAHGRGTKSTDSAWTKLTHRGVPLIERVRGDRTKLLVTFVWRPPSGVTSPSIYTPIVDFTRGETALQPVGKTGVWYRSFRLSRKTLASYGFSPRPSPSLTANEKAWGRYLRSVKPDPLNPSRLSFPKDPDDPSDFAMVFSLVELPGAAPQPWCDAREPSQWREEYHRIRSRILRNIRSVWVYLPSDFNPRYRRYNLLLVFDGPLYRETVPTPRIVENLVAAGRLSATVIALVGNAPHARTKDLLQNPAFPDFLARELLPWLRRRYRLRVDPPRTVLAGSSMGGLTAAYAALRYPKLFGNVLAQSGSFQIPGKAPASLMEQFARSPRLPLHFYLDAGTHEKMVPRGWPASLLGSVRHMRDVLVAKGYPVAYAEFEGGHDYACWRGTLADGLLKLVGRPERAV